MANNQELAIEYSKWGIIVLTTIGGFKIFRKKIVNSFVLFLAVISPTWLIYSFLTGLQYIYFKNLFMLYSVDGFILLMFECLASTLLIGGITFWKLNSNWRKKESIE